MWGASWNNNGIFATDRTYSIENQQKNADELKKIIPNLNNSPYVERYAYWNSEADCSKIIKDGALSIAGEYYHLDFIKSFDTDLIEMETGSFYRLAAMMEKPAVAILVVSDNSATGAPLLGRPEVQQDAYNTSRRILLAKLLEIIANM